ncbi:MAG TPA: hypothetical protein VNB64_11285, partial [Solirubrobacteraceae bacterium]|nr:hypothetical protein [Solirubrobacteraceae bacterium]
GASADITFANPSCTVAGMATFEEHLTATQKANRYDFASGDPRGGTAPDTSKCSGVLNGVAVKDEPVKVQVSGPGNLSCAQSESTGEGPGTVLFLSSGIVVPFTLSFTAIATEVDLTVKGTKSGQGKGSASFKAYAPPGAPLECEGLADVDNDGKHGLKKLGFDASFASDGALVAPSPPPSGSGGGGPSGGGGGGIPNTITPSYTFRAVTQPLRAALRRGIGVTLRGNAPARARLSAQLTAATARRYGLARTVGRGTVELRRAGQTMGFVRLTPVARRRLARARNLRVKLVGTIVDVTRRTTPVSRNVLLR